MAHAINLRTGKNKELFIDISIAKSLNGTKIKKFLLDAGHSLSALAKRALKSKKFSFAKKRTISIEIPQQLVQNVGNLRFCKISHFLEDKEKTALTSQIICLIRYHLSNEEIQKLGLDGIIFELPEKNMYIGKPIAFGPHNYDSDSLLCFDFSPFNPLILRGFQTEN